MERKELEFHADSLPGPPSQLHSAEVTVAHGVGATLGCCPEASAEGCMGAKPWERRGPSRLTPVLSTVRLEVLCHQLVAHRPALHVAVLRAHSDRPHVQVPLPPTTLPVCAPHLFLIPIFSCSSFCLLFVSFSLKHVLFKNELCVIYFINFVLCFIVCGFYFSPSFRPLLSVLAVRGVVCESGGHGPLSSQR